MSISMQAEGMSLSIDDATLAAQCRRGDGAAMDRLIKKYQDRLYNVILKICGNEHDAVELLQDTFVKVIEKIGSFESRSGLYTWIYRIAVNLTLNHCKRRMKFTMQGLEIACGLENARAGLRRYLAAESITDPAKIAESRELCVLLHKALGMLDHDQRSIIVLCDIERMNYAQISSVLEIELGTVKSRLSRARSNLRKSLESVL